MLCRKKRTGRRWYRWMIWRWCISWWRRTSSATWRGLPLTRASSSSYWPCWTRTMPTSTAKSVTTSWRSTSKCSSQCCRNILILVHTLHITFFHVIFSVCIITLKCVLLKLPNKWYLRTSITRVNIHCTVYEDTYFTCLFWVKSLDFWA